MGRKPWMSPDANGRGQQSTPRFFLSWSDKKLGIVAREDMLFRCYETSKIPKNQNRLNHVYLFHKCILIINALHVLQINVLLDIDRYF